MNKKEIDIEGHRGCRGLLPENTLSAFEKALSLGVTTLEMDVVISHDFKVVVSHEPWFNPEITSTPEGFYLNDEAGRELNIYEMNYEEVRKYDVGRKAHPRFLEQLKRSEVKPLLSEVIRMAEDFCKENKRTEINYNIEIKSSEEDEREGYQPKISVFCNLVMYELIKHKIVSRCTIQSFDVRVLKYMHAHFPAQALSYLVENNSNYNDALKLLGFKPEIYSCDFNLLSKSTVDDLHFQDIKVVPWTVNKRSDIRSLLNMGVDGIISDYPNRAIEVEKE